MISIAEYFLNIQMLGLQYLLKKIIKELTLKYIKTARSHLMI